MIIEVNEQSPVPPYEQIRGRIVELVLSGELPPGTRLPSIRQLAGDLAVAPNTVARAFRELEAVGVLASRRRHGTSVTADATERARSAPPPLRSTAPPSPEPDTLDRAARDYADRARGLGHGPEEAVAALRRAWERRGG
ncbi:MULTISPECIES: GntR family transcriptional regulator [unclassified Nocardiopsis]|uniref:GntR family transcriptional regulator n=2 Tax=Nocardiopsidaceae TaxID=83676 RepID=UPI00387AD197